MSTALACGFCLLLYVLGYRFYAGFLARRVFSLREERDTPAHRLLDGVDYLPTRPSILFGHHFASITGLAPMLGPAVAVIWGWLPAMLWVVLGALLVGCVHDFSALVLSVRARGLSIGVVAEGIVGKRAKSLFHTIIFFGIALAMGVFVYVIAHLFEADRYPQAAVPSGGLMLVAMVMGYFLHVRRARLLFVTALGFAAMLALVWIGKEYGPSWAARAWPEERTWRWTLLAYGFLASVLPVWTLLQPRDFVNSLLLYLGLGLLYVGIFVDNPTFAAPAVVPEPAGAPPLFPFVFIVIACGAASGFHALVSSGTTAKQLDRETDARPIGYGGMIGESLLGLAAVLACTAAAQPPEAWTSPDGVYASWAAIQAPGRALSNFIEGGAHFVSAVGLSRDGAVALIAVVVVSFALTTLDSATRLLRFNIQEIAEGLGARWLAGRVTASVLAVAAIGFFALSDAGLELWPLFGTVNQMLAGLALLVASLYLYQRRRPWWVCGLPTAFMLVSTFTAMVENLVQHARKGNGTLAVVGAILLVLAAWLVVEAVLAVRRARRAPPKTALDIQLP